VRRIYRRFPRTVLALVFLARGRADFVAGARFGAFLRTAAFLALDATRLAFARVAARARFGLALRTAGPAVRPAPARLALVLRATRFALRRGRLGLLL